MLKEKNREAAMALVAAKPTPKLTPEKTADLIADLSVAEKAYEEIDAATKKHYKEIYEPMCAKKREAEIKMWELRIRVEQLGGADPAIAKLVALVQKAIAAKVK